MTTEAFEGVMLAESYNPAEHGCAGMLLSEKLDGVRALWTGAELVTRNGNRLECPTWFTEGLPEARLDGELWLGRGRFDEASGIVRRKRGDGSAWSGVRFMLFDAPDEAGGLERRLRAAAQVARRRPWMGVVEQTPCTGPEHLERELRRIVGAGGEGVMLRSPSARWRAGRSSAMLKVKPRDELDGVVTGYVTRAGDARIVRALRCVAPGPDGGGVVVDVGSGLSEVDRVNPPALGSIVRIMHLGRTPSGVPRHPSFAGVRADVACCGSC